MLGLDGNPTSLTSHPGTAQQQGFKLGRLFVFSSRSVVPIISLVCMWCTRNLKNSVRRTSISTEERPRVMTLHCVQYPELLGGLHCLNIFVPATIIWELRQFVDRKIRRTLDHESTGSSCSGSVPSSLAWPSTSPRFGQAGNHVPVIMTSDAGTGNKYSSATSIQSVIILESPFSRSVLAERHPCGLSQRVESAIGRTGKWPVLGGE